MVVRVRAEWSVRDFFGSVDRQMLLPERCDSVAFRDQLVLVDQWRHLLELEPVFCGQVERKDFQ